MSRIEAGEIVGVRLLDPTKKEYNDILWIVVEILGARLHLKGTLPSTGSAKHISVCKEKVCKATLTCAPSIPHSMSSFGDLIQNAIVHHTGGCNEDSWDPSSFLDQWMHLPLLGGNTFLLRRSEAKNHLPLVMFPRLNLMCLELWFHSRWSGESMQLIDADGLKPCPAQQIWPYCQWCCKFHLPFEGPGSHRCSQKHKQFCKNWMSDTGIESLGRLRDMCERFAEHNVL